VILWTVIIAGLRTYGATFRKMALRLVGGIIGGVVGLAMIIIVTTPNFETVLSYMIVCFIALGAGRLRSAEQRAYQLTPRVRPGPSFRPGLRGTQPERGYLCAALARMGGLLLGIANRRIRFSSCCGPTMRPTR